MECLKYNNGIFINYASVQKSLAYGKMCLKQIRTKWWLGFQASPQKQFSSGHPCKEQLLQSRTLQGLWAQGIQYLKALVICGPMSEVDGDSPLLTDALPSFSLSSVSRTPSMAGCQTGRRQIGAEAEWALFIQKFFSRGLLLKKKRKEIFVKIIPTLQIASTYKALFLNKSYGFLFVLFLFF